MTKASFSSKKEAVLWFCPSSAALRAPVPDRCLWRNAAGSPFVGDGAGSRYLVPVRAEFSGAGGRGVWREV